MRPALPLTDHRLDNPWIPQALIPSSNGDEHVSTDPTGGWARMCLPSPCSVSLGHLTPDTQPNRTSELPSSWRKALVAFRAGHPGARPSLDSYFSSVKWS